MENNLSRRGFFKTLVSITGLAVAAPTVLNSIFGSTASAQERRRGAAPAGGAMPMVDVKDPVAKAVKYIEDHSKSPESKGNTCKSCSFYAKKEDRNGKEVGTCTIFAGKLVVGNGWCASWNKKA